MTAPLLRDIGVSRETADNFAGLDLSPRIASNCFSDMKNMTSDRAPLLSVRRGRAKLTDLSSPNGLAASAALAYVDGCDFYYDGQKIAGLTLSDSKKTIVSQGAYLVIFPDKVYFNTSDSSDFGSLEASFTDSGIVFTLSSITAADYSYVSSDTTPSAPSDGDYFLDTSVTPASLKLYSGGLWSAIPSTYIKISRTGIGADFSECDGIEISGVSEPSLNGSFTVEARGDDYLLVAGVLSFPLTESAQVTIRRRVPDMDYVVEAQNRLWGCRYGSSGGVSINEIYASRLGDFKNFSSYLGISGDSYTASVGSDGPFTGAVTLLGCPIFFKENCLHKVYVSPSGAHSVIHTPCRGVAPGCSASVALMGDRVYYKSRDGVCRYDGSLPVLLYDNFAAKKFFFASGGVLGSKYYLSAKDSSDDFHLFVYDAARDMWNREDSINAACFTPFDGKLFFFDMEAKTLLSTGDVISTEGVLSWYAVTGTFGFDSDNRKYLSRITLRCRLAKDAYYSVSIEYDDSGVFEQLFSCSRQGTHTFSFNARPRRCDRYRLRISGVGDFSLYSLTREWSRGA